MKLGLLGIKVHICSSWAKFDPNLTKNEPKLTLKTQNLQFLIEPCMTLHKIESFGQKVLGHWKIV